MFFAAFSLRLSNSHQYNNGETIPFDVVMLNVDNAYNPSTGIYTALLTGNYAFSWTIGIAGSPGYYVTDIVVNSNIIGVLNINRGEDDSETTGMTVMSLQSGDRVFMRAQRRSGSVSIYSSDSGSVSIYSSDSGYSIYI